MYGIYIKRREVFEGGDEKRKVVLKWATIIREGGSRQGVKAYEGGGALRRMEE